MILHEAFTALRHGGNLLSPEALASLPAPPPTRVDLADRLRDAFAAMPHASRSGAEVGGAGEAMSALLDLVLEHACGLAVGWRKASKLGAADAQKLLDGTVLRPRRLMEANAGERLAVFTTPSQRVGVGGGRRAVAHVVEYLRRKHIPFGLLTNGREWRLIWADPDVLAWVEWDADWWLAAEVVTDEFEVLRRLVGWPALALAPNGVAPLLAAIRATRQGQSKLSQELGERVRRAVETLLRARAPVVAPAWDTHGQGDVYVAACHVVMRLVVILFAEARELLPVDNPVYQKAYGVRGLIDQLDRMTPERRRARNAAWPRLLALFRLLHEGSPHPGVVVPAYGGELFKAGDPAGDGVQRALALLERLESPPDDDAIHDALLLLTRTESRIREGTIWRKVASPVDFTELTSEYIGILYEGLLDYELHRVGAEPMIFLNLGDQPALPLDWLEQMDDKALAALVEKAKIKREAADSDAEDSSDAGEDEPAEDDETEADAEAIDTPAIGDVPEAEGDERGQAFARALAWARRAAVAGKLAKKPSGRGGATDAGNAEQWRKLDLAARQLVADVKLPGELFLVRWGGTRKGAGTFYTRRELTTPTVRRTLEPLIMTDGQVVTPEVLLALKVCDPAMGSGSFLVAALRVLTAAVVESLHVHPRISVAHGRAMIACEALPEADRNLPAEGLDERLEALVRRAVVEHCLYGVDLDPLAVELGRVALWVETLDRRLPFTFLDHKLRCGDALIGTWVDRFRDYPLLAFSRQSPDKGWKGVHHAADTWDEALKARRAEVIFEQVAVLNGQLSMAPAPPDDELKAAVSRVRGLYGKLREVPAGRPDERARIWQEDIKDDPAVARVREAFDTWCALWFWPLARLDLAPGPRSLHAPEAAARGIVKSVRDRMRFFHWELEFPDVFTEVGAGFDAVVGNPPWEIQKPNSKEFFSNHDPLYRAYGKQEALAVQRRLFDDRPEMEEAWLQYNGGFKDKGGFVRFAAEPFGDGKSEKHGGGEVMLARGDAGEAMHRTWRTRRATFQGLSDPEHPFRHQGSAALNTYKNFVEVGHALLRCGGQLGLVVPSGIYTDKGSSVLRTLLLARCDWRWLYGFENRNKLFDIDSRFKFCVCIARKGGRTLVLQSAFMRQRMEDWASAIGALAYPESAVKRLSPLSTSLLEVSSVQDLSIAATMYAETDLLSAGGWAGTGGRELNMTDDSSQFTRMSDASALGLVEECGVWSDRSGHRYLPLVQGISIDAFNSTSKRWESGSGLQAKWSDLSPDQHNAYRPQYLVREDLLAKFPRVGKSWKVGYTRIRRNTDERTMMAAALQRVPAGDSIFFVFIEPDSHLVLGLVAGLNSFAFDWLLRQRMGGTNISWFFLSEMPMAPPKQLKAAAGLARRLNCTSTLTASAWLGVESDRAWRRLWAITPHERLRLRCMLDAIVAVLYGLDRDDFAWILKDCDHPAARLAEKPFCRTLDPKGFFRVDKAVDPELRHTVLSLAAFDDLQLAIAAAGGDRDAGIAAFCDQHEGDGWMLPESLCLADLRLTRTVDVEAYDSRAQAPQPVRARMGERFLDWQLAQTPEESWDECERHARALAEGGPAEPAPATRPGLTPKPDTGQLSLLLPDEDD